MPKESLADWAVRTSPRLNKTTPDPVSKPSPRLVRIKVWAVIVFGEDAPPHPNTLRRWVSDGRIYPAPVMVGKSWYVSPEAQYVSD